REFIRQPRCGPAAPGQRHLRRRNGKRAPGASRARVDPECGIRGRRMTFTTKPLTAATWPDLEAIFNGRGCSVARACWCMYYRKTGSTGWGAADYARIKETNRKQLKALADGGRQAGLVGYQDG